MFGEENKVFSSQRGEKQGNILNNKKKKKMTDEEEQSSKLELCTINFYYGSLKCKKFRILIFSYKQLPNANVYFQNVLICKSIQEMPLIYFIEDRF